MFEWMDRCILSQRGMPHSTPSHQQAVDQASTAPFSRKPKAGYGNRIPTLITEDRNRPTANVEVHQAWGMEDTAFTGQATIDKRTPLMSAASRGLAMISE